MRETRRGNNGAATLYIARRVLRCLLSLADFGFFYVLHLTPWFQRKSRRSPANRFRMLLENIGGAFVKFGQMLSLQPDVLPLEYCESLLDLLDSLAPMPFEVVAAIITDEFGANSRRLVSHLRQEPLAVASIAQVHLAEMDGDILAVKVRRPTATLEFTADLRIMRAGLYFIRFFHLRSLYWLISPTQEFIGWTRDELDFRVEARHMQALRKHSQGNPRQYIPRVHDEWLTRAVLVTEFLPGMSLLNYLRALRSGSVTELSALADSGFLPREFASNLVQNFIGDAFRCGMFHGDVHPANLIILPLNRVGYVDFGITGMLSVHSRRALVDMTLAYSRGDIDGMVRSFMKVSTRGNKSDTARFYRDVRSLSVDWYGESPTELRFRQSITSVMFELLRVSRKTGMLPHRDVVKYIRSAIVTDGLIRRFAPGFDIGRGLEQACAEQLRTFACESIFSRSRVLEWMEATRRLTLDGFGRADATIEALQQKLQTESNEEKRDHTSVLLTAGGTGFRWALLSLLISALMIFFSRVGGGSSVAIAGFWGISATLALINLIKRR